jgi:ketosteroid isomerase-like protein
VELARRGYQALISGDVDAVFELLAPDLSWQGWEPGEGDCHSRAEAMSVIKERLHEHAIGELEEIIDVDDQRIVVLTKQIASVVTIREGKVISIRDYRTKGEALAAASDEGDGA